MKNQKKELFNAFGTIVMMVFVVFVLSSFSGKSIKQPRVSRYETTSEFHTNQAKGAIDVQIPAVQKSCVSLLPNLWIGNHKIFAENKKTNQIIVVFQKTQQSTKPNIPTRYYYHRFPKNAEDLPDFNNPIS
jgi:hypothetical protein